MAYWEQPRTLIHVILSIITAVLSRPQRFLGQICPTKLLRPGNSPGHGYQWKIYSKSMIGLRNIILSCVHIQEHYSIQHQKMEKY